MSIRELFVSVR